MSSLNGLRITSSRTALRIAIRRSSTYLKRASRNKIPRTSIPINRGLTHKIKNLRLSEKVLIGHLSTKKISVIICIFYLTIVIQTITIYIMKNKKYPQLILRVNEELESRIEKRYKTYSKSKSDFIRLCIATCLLMDANEMRKYKARFGTLNLVLMPKDFEGQSKLISVEGGD